MSGITKQQQADLAVDAYNSRTVTKQWEKPINIVEGMIIKFQQSETIPRQVIMERCIKMSEPMKLSLPTEGQKAR